MRDHIIIIGAGMMGVGIAARSALAGNPTVLVSRRKEMLNISICQAESCIDELYANGLVPVKQAAEAKQRLSATLDWEEACAKACCVIESIQEDLEAKQHLFCQLDAILPPSVPILSNTSGLRITDIAAKVQYPQRTLTAHFWFPAHLVPFVEVVIGDQSSAEMAQQVRDMLKDWGKQPVIVKKDLNGQLGNRILQAIIREAVNIVEIGLAEPEDVDLAIKYGMGLRFPVWGPLEHVDGVGIDLCYRVQQSVLPEISSSTQPAQLFQQKYEAGDLGYKTGKGFYDWSQKDMDQLARTRNEFIIYALRFLQEKQK